MITDTTGNEISRDSSSVKLRLARVFKRAGQTMVEMNAEIKLLTHEDLQWYADRFTEEGYPTTVAAV